MKEILTPLDVKRVHEYDTEEPRYNFSDETLIKIKRYSRTRRVFAANAARHMFSVQERARDANISGTKNREMLSPQKSRFDRICTYTAKMYDVEVNSQLASEIRVSVDEANRKFREDLKGEKFKRDSNPH